jgi:hypothetical protein
VSLPQLRQAARDAFAAKVCFDAAVLRLAQAGKVALHRHDFPASLGEENRASLVQDARGKCFVAAA